jgi:hypothetical protein
MFVFEQMRVTTYLHGVLVKHLLRAALCYSKHGLLLEVLGRPPSGSWLQSKSLKGKITYSSNMHYGMKRNVIHVKGIYCLHFQDRMLLTMTSL